MEKDKNFILEATFKFAQKIILYCEILESKRKYVVARQLIKSGNSIGANVREAQHPETKADFIHKMKIALKEADETDYWLSLCQVLESYPYCNDLLQDLNPIIKVISKIIISAKKS